MLASNVNSAGLIHSSNEGIGLDADRWIFAFMAALLFITVLTGFIPDSISNIEAVKSGQRSAFPAVLHFHAALMGSWILLLLTQTSLVATGHTAVHKKLGLISFALVPAIVIAGFILVPINFQRVWNLDPTVISSEALAVAKAQVSNIALFQIRIGILFSFYVALALYFRKSDSQTHKRLMILATVIPMPAAVTRISWIPTSFPANGASPDIAIFCLILPLLVYDLYRQKRLPRAYIMWGAGWIGTSIVVHSLWNSPWWLSVAPRLMGVES